MTTSLNGLWETIKSPKKEELLMSRENEARISEICKKLTEIGSGNGALNNSIKFLFEKLLRIF